MAAKSIRINPNTAGTLCGNHSTAAARRELDEPTAALDPVAEAEIYSGADAQTVELVLRVLKSC